MSTLASWGTRDALESAAITSSSSLPFVYAPAPSGGDDYATLQAYIDTNFTLGLDVVLHLGTYLVSQELLISTTGRMRGQGHAYTSNRTTIRATASMRSVIAVHAGYGTLEYVKLDANQQATYGVHFQSSSYAHLREVYALNAKIDGFFLPGTGVNDSMEIRECWATDNGTVYGSSALSASYTGYARFSTIAGTAAVTSGNATVTFTGAPDLTTFGFRKGDFIRVGTQYLMIESVAASTITVTSGRLPTATLSGQSFAISLGDGWHESSHVDNNINKIYGGLWRNNAGAAFSLHGVFAPYLIGVQPDMNGFYGVCFGFADNANPVASGVVEGIYFESGANLAADFFFGMMSNCKIDGVLGGTYHSRVAQSDGYVFGYWINPATKTLEAIPGSAPLSAFSATFHDSDVAGRAQSFRLTFTKSGATLSHTIDCGPFNLNVGTYAGRITSASAVTNTTPLIGAGTNFTAGVGIVSATPTQLMFDTADQGTGASFLASSSGIEVNSTGTAYTVRLNMTSININGVTRMRPVLELFNLSGGAVAWNAIPDGSLQIRLNLYLK